MEVQNDSGEAMKTRKHGASPYAPRVRSEDYSFQTHEEREEKRQGNDCKAVAFLAELPW